MRKIITYANTKESEYWATTQDGEMLSPKLGSEVELALHLKEELNINLKKSDYKVGPKSTADFVTVFWSIW